MDWLTIDDDLIVNLDNVTGIERSAKGSRIYLGNSSSSITTALDYDSLRTIIFQRKKAMQSGSWTPSP